MLVRRTEGGALVDVLEGDDGGEDEDEGEEEGEEEDGVEDGPEGDEASCDLELHQVQKPIAARYRDASHARREPNLHRPRWRRPSRQPWAATGGDGFTVLTGTHVGEWQGEL